MKTTEFNKLVRKRLNATKTTLIAKADEYARGDRLSNFKKAAAVMDSTPEKALAGLVVKHYVATMDFIADLDKGKLQPMPRWEEKIGDIIAYMCLLEALISERSFAGTAKKRN